MPARETLWVMAKAFAVVAPIGGLGTVLVNVLDASDFVAGLFLFGFCIGGGLFSARLLHRAEQDYARRRTDGPLPSSS